MDITLADVADELGTSVTRVTRAVNRLQIPLFGPPKRGGPGRTMRHSDAERLRAELGSSPPSSHHGREELFVLSALAADPGGFASVRALARAAGISPTTAAAKVERLVKHGLVTRRPGLTRMSGRVVDATLIAANRSGTAWARHEALINATVPPRAKDGRPPIIVPRRFWHLFWNAQPATLRVTEQADYIAARLLLSNDRHAADWAIAHLPASSIQRVGELRGVSVEYGQRLREMAETARRA